jgi:hypothetical protein
LYSFFHAAYFSQAGAMGQSTGGVEDFKEAFSKKACKDTIF